MLTDIGILEPLAEPAEVVFQGLGVLFNDLVHAENGAFADLLCNRDELGLRLNTGVSRRKRT